MTNLGHYLVHKEKLNQKFHIHSKIICFIVCFLKAGELSSSKGTELNSWI